MLMMYALDVMSRNLGGEFQWNDQLIAILNAMGDNSVSKYSTTEEILEAVKNLDHDSKKVLLSTKVSFKKNVRNSLDMEEEEIKKESQKLFYGFTFLVLIATVFIVWSSGNSGVEPETISKFMDFGLSLLKMLGDGDSG